MITFYKTLNFEHLPWVSKEAKAFAQLINASDDADRLWRDIEKDVVSEIGNDVVTHTITDPTDGTDVFSLRQLEQTFIEVCKGYDFGYIPEQRPALTETQLRAIICQTLNCSSLTEIEDLITPEMVDSGYLVKAIEREKFEDRALDMQGLFESACLCAFSDIFEPHGYDAEKFKVDANWTDAKVWYEGKVENADQFAELNAKFCDKVGFEIEL